LHPDRWYSWPNNFDWVSRERSPIKNLGRNAVFPVDATNNSPKDLPVHNKLVLGLHEITLAVLLFKYTRNLAYRFRDNAE
jgi:hypothetical protein